MFDILLCFKNGTKELIQERELNPYLARRKFIPFNAKATSIEDLGKMVDTVTRFMSNGEIRDLDLYIYKEM